MRLKTLALAAAAAMLATSIHAATITVSANITASETWTANNVYVLDFPVYVTNGSTLTIEPGTVVRGQGYRVQEPTAD